LAATTNPISIEIRLSSRLFYMRWPMCRFLVGAFLAETHHSLGSRSVSVKPATHPLLSRRFNRL
jgi:hypothetical protein